LPLFIRSGGFLKFDIFALSRFASVITA
jgi:hypothetical protein